MSDQRAANAVDIRLGQRVRVRRLELGMSQERLAEILGITFQQVQKYERGVNRIAASRLWDVSKALEMPVAKFFDGFDTKKPAAGQGRDRLADALATPEGNDLVALFASIKSRPTRRKVVELVRTLAQGEGAH